MKKHSSRAIVVLAAGVVAMVVVFHSAQVLAVTAPAAGSFAYDIYDIAIAKILKGPIGFVAGAAAVVIGSIMTVRSQVLPGILAILGGAAMIKADAIVGTLGAMISSVM